MLFDVHTHLQDVRFAGRREDVLLRAREAGVTRIGCCATSEADWDAVGKLGTRPDVLPCLGVHPWWAAKVEPGWDERLNLRLAEGLYAVGEAGLDGTLEEETRDVQQEVFERQVALAVEWQRPIMVHGARAWAWLREVLERCSELPPAILLHSFGGRAEDVPAFVDLGCYFSFGGTITRHGYKHAKEALKAVPEDRLLVETDAPDQCPEFEGRPEDGINEPAFISVVVGAVAKILACDEDLLRSQLVANASGLFSSVMEKVS